MDRRDFLTSTLSWGATTVPILGAVRSSRAVTRGGKLQIQYIREKIPSFEIPPYRGRLYEDRVPDTLDIAERAKLAIHALTSITDPDADYEIYGVTQMFRNPPVMVHDFNDWVQNQEGLMEALPLLRVATGSEENSQVDRVWMETTLKSIGPDGLYYVPLEGRPWGRLRADGINPVWKATGERSNFEDLSVKQIANVSTCHRMISTMIIYYLRDRNPMWKSTIEKMIDRLSSLAVQQDDFCYFAPGSWEPGVKFNTRPEMPLGSTWGVSWNTRLLQGLGQYYQLSGYEPARDLAKKIVAYTRFHGEIFKPDGVWFLDPEIRGRFRSLAVPDSIRAKYKVEGLDVGGHGHGHGIGLLSVLDYGFAVGDRDLVEFVKTGFEWARNPGSSYNVSLLAGWFPEFYVPEYPSCEGCIVGDLLSLALKLTAAGAGDYWDDIDRWARNQFAEQQLTGNKVKYVYELGGRSPSKPVAPNESADRPAERNFGAYAGGASANDFALGVASSGIGHCCTGTCTRTLYYVWEHMVHHKDSQLWVNLLMNRASKWADIYSYIPYEGRVDLKMKEGCRSVRVRAPEWLESRSPQIVCKVNGTLRPLGWEGRFVELGAVTAGDKVTLAFPISERTVKEKAGPETYTLVIRGNTIVAIDPPGKNIPMYQDRRKYRKGEVGWMQANRFVSDETIVW